MKKPLIIGTAFINNGNIKGIVNFYENIKDKNIYLLL